MKYHGSPMGLMGLRLTEGSPTSPTTLEGGTSGTTQAGPRSGTRSQLVDYTQPLRIRKGPS